MQSVLVSIMCVCTLMCVLSGFLDGWRDRGEQARTRSPHHMFISGSPKESHSATGSQTEPHPSGHTCEGVSPLGVMIYKVCSST